MVPVTEGRVRFGSRVVQWVEKQWLGGWGFKEDEGIAMMLSIG